MMYRPLSFLSLTTVVIVLMTTCSRWVNVVNAQTDPPSSFPNDTPSIFPSDTPTDPPSSFPNDSMSSFPNDTPSNAPSSPLPLGDLVCTIPELNVLCTLLTIFVPEVKDLLNDPDPPKTLFAPDNAACSTLIEVQPSNEELERIILGHVIPMEITATELVCDSSLTAINGLVSQTECDPPPPDNPVDFFQVGPGNMVLGVRAPILTFGIIGSNGVIHIIRGLVLPLDFPTAPPTSGECDICAGEGVVVNPKALVDFDGIFPGPLSCDIIEEQLVLNIQPSGSPECDFLQSLTVPACCGSAIPTTTPLTEEPSISPAPSLPLTINDYICGRDEFSTLCELMSLTNNMLDVVNGQFFTLFAPTNDAFDAIRDDLCSLETEELDFIMRFHYIFGSRFASDLECDCFVGQMANLLMTQTKCQGNTPDNTTFFQVAVDPGNVPTTNLPQIIEFDINTLNGVIHVVNNVIRTETIANPTPSPFEFPAPVSPISPISPVSPVSPVSPISPISPVAPSPVAPSPIAPVFLAPVFNPTPFVSMLSICTPSSAPSAGPSISGTVSEVACANPDLSTLCSLLELTGLDALLNDPDTTFTVFAPTNAAFDAISGITGDLTTEEIAFVLLYHTVFGEVFASDLVCGNFVEMANLLTTETQCQSLVGGRQVNTPDNTLFFQVGTANDPSMLPQIVQFDIKTLNGVVHVVDNVILPAAPTGAPTSAPTPSSKKKKSAKSAEPSSAPSVSSAPVGPTDAPSAAPSSPKSKKGAKSAEPSSAPSVSSAPSTSAAPTGADGKKKSPKGKGGKGGKKGKKSAEPSSAPSDLPSVSSAPSVSGAPSDVPSASPTDVPSTTPSVSPSASPTVSAAPSATPSASPTAAPTTIIDGLLAQIEELEMHVMLLKGCLHANTDKCELGTLTTSKTAVFGAEVEIAGQTVDIVEILP